MRCTFAGMACLAALHAAAGAEVYTVTISHPGPPQAEGFVMGESHRPDGATITLDSCSLRLDGKPWTPVMGEFHYSRYPETEWREELLKMKAGGIDIVATYVFWIHHEEIQDRFDWSGRRNLRGFIEAARDVGLKAIVRCGPWCHGEVRNGGLPDWILKKGWVPRSDDPDYLDRAGVFYRQIATQLHGLLWKDGGPVIGIQLENEYGGPAEHLLDLKRIARDAGLDVPLYTRTGWPELRTPMPFGQIVPLYGVYAEGFWDREITPMPGRYWAGFHFSPLRSDSAIATDLLGRRDAKDAPDAARYPYLTCEIGGGMMNSYHRRILIRPADIEATTLVKLGSGSNSPGYYMYHGGVNPEGRLTTLQESQATEMTNWNDLPVKNYDFQAPLGEYGQLRPQYHLLRRLHLFLHEWGASLAGMAAVMPDRRPSGRDDVGTLRWAARSNGAAGLIFVNNYQRLASLPAKQGVQFGLRLPPGSLTFPHEPVTIPADARFFWPFNFDLGDGVQLVWATAQPVCAVEDAGARTVFFARTPGLPVEFTFNCAPKGPFVSAPRSNPMLDGDRIVVCAINPGRDAAVNLRPAEGGAIDSVRVVVLDDTDSRSLWKGFWQGRERVFLTRAGLVLDGEALRLTSTDPAELTVGVYPAPGQVTVDGARLAGEPDGVFQRFTPALPPAAAFEAGVEVVQPAGPARTIPLGKIKQPVAAAPQDADFEKAAVWHIKLPPDLDLDLDPILRLHYVGDVARVLLDGRLLTDDFYNGRPLEVGLRRYVPEVLRGDLRVAILPLRKDAPIYLASEARPDFGEAASVVALSRVEIVPRYHVQLLASSVDDAKPPQ